MNDQSGLSELDVLRLQVLQLREQLLVKDRAILSLETRLFQQQLHETYGNPGEKFEVTPDHRIVRHPVPVEVSDG